MSFQERPKIIRNRFVQEHCDYELEIENNLPKHSPFNLLIEKVSSTPTSAIKRKMINLQIALFMHNKPIYFTNLTSTAKR